jgi:hypothetical protein
MLWVGVGLGVLIIFAVPALLERYAAHQGDSGYRTKKLASTSGLLLGVGIAMLFATPMSGLGVLVAGAGVSAFLLLWFRRPRGRRQAADALAPICPSALRPSVSLARLTACTRFGQPVRAPCHLPGGRWHASRVYGLRRAAYRVRYSGQPPSLSTPW